MAITLISDIVPQNNGSFPTHSDIYGKGGFQVRDTTTDRNTIPILNRKIGMLVYVVADGKYYTLSGGLLDINWVEANLGSKVLPSNIITTSTTLTDDNVVAMVSTRSSILTINLLPTPATGRDVIIKDESGQAGTYPILINGNGHTIDGSSIYTIAVNYGGIRIIYSGNRWAIV